MSIAIYHNPKCSTSRKVLGFLREAGIEPEIVEYLKMPPSKTKLKELLKQMGIAPRALLRRKEKLYAELGLDDAQLSDADLIAAMAEHPILIERPIVVTDKGAVLCRPPERVFELLASHPQPAAGFGKTARRRPASSTHIMRASLDSRIYREFEIESNKSLYNLAAAIIKVFGFDFDHAFGFYSKLGGHIFDSPVKYLLFVDMGDVEFNALGVKKTKIAQAFAESGIKMTFLFDYGDEWRFRIEMIGEGERQTGMSYPKLLKSVGKAPEQYPDFDDEEEED
jgi:arsenate reductase (glutaredoxin)